MTFTMGSINIALIVPMNREPLATSYWQILRGVSRSFQKKVQNRSQLVTSISASHK